MIVGDIRRRKSQVQLCDNGRAEVRRGQQVGREEARVRPEARDDRVHLLANIESHDRH